jgi:hypothetical protein
MPSAFVNRADTSRIPLGVHPDTTSPHRRGSGAGIGRRRTKERHMYGIRTARTRHLIATCAGLVLGITACGGDDSTTARSDPGGVGSATTLGQPAGTPAPTTEERNTVPDTTVGEAEPPPETTSDESWRDDAVAWCQRSSERLAAIAPPESNEDVARLVRELIAGRELDSESLPDWPAEVSGVNLNEVSATQDRWMDVASEQLAAGNIGALGDPPFADNAWGSTDRSIEGAATMATALAIAGVECGPANPELMSKADLSVPIADAWQLETGFGSVWVSSRVDETVHRLDAVTGEELAEIQVDSLPIKLQPASGRMILRTEDAYVAIDPATDAVVATLHKSDVGPNADRSWAVDDALWICDGHRMHRYDPVTFEPVTTIELGFECGQVYATDDLVIPWSYNQDPGESGASVAAFVDPASNQTLATVDLPADVNVPIVLNDRVVFPPSGSEPLVVVDRVTWTATSRTDIGVGSGSQAAFDGESIYIITAGAEHDIAVVDAETLEVTDTIPAFEFAPPFDGGVNSIAVSPGAVWVVNNSANLLQRFDRPA